MKIKRFIDGPLRGALRNEQFVNEQLALVKVGVDRGDPPWQAFAIAIASLVKAVASKAAPDGNIVAKALSRSQIEGKRSASSEHLNDIQELLCENGLGVDLAMKLRTAVYTDLRAGRGHQLSSEELSLALSIAMCWLDIELTEAAAKHQAESN